LIAAQEKQLQALRAQVERYKKALEMMKNDPLVYNSPRNARSVADNALKGGEK